MEERDAIAELKRGNLHGLEVLVDRYYLRAVQAVYLTVLDQNQAEDIVQASFIQAVEKIEQFDTDRKFGPWFIRIAINRALNVAQEQKRFVSIDDEISDNDLMALNWLPNVEPGLEENMLQAELQHTVWEAIQKLTPKQRTVIVMRYFLDFDETEMMKELKSPLSSIKWWLHSARKKLRGLLQFRVYDNRHYESQISFDPKKE